VVLVCTYQFANILLKKRRYTLARSGHCEALFLNSDFGISSNFIELKHRDTSGISMAWSTYQFCYAYKRVFMGSSVF